MNINRIYHLLAVLVCTMGLITASSAADYKIGVVNAVAVLEAAPQSDAARKKLEKEFSSKDKELVAKQKGLKSLEDRLKKDGAIMSEGERGRLERDILQKRRELKRDQDEFREDVNFRRNEEFGQIQKKIVEAIRAVAAEEKYDLVLGEGVIYASKTVDITESVIKKLKAGK
ncbi:MAG: OmpH family outer membrane protein [Pseudomonadota bacterium]